MVKQNKVSQFSIAALDGHIKEDPGRGMVCVVGQGGCSSKQYGECVSCCLV